MEEGGGKEEGVREEEEEEGEAWWSESSDEEGEGEGGGNMSQQVQEFFSELDISCTRQRRRVVSTGLKVPRRKSMLPAHLHSVMGGANLRLARGDPPGAIQLCREVIRQAPHVAEPYLTLATIYEDLGDRQRLLQRFLIFAASICFLLRDYSTSFTFLRQLCLKFPGLMVSWNLLSCLPADNRMQKFVLRLFFKQTSNPLLMRLHANYSHTNSNYKLALNQYQMAYEESSEDYLLCLCIAVVYLSMANQKHTVYRSTNALVSQAIGFLHKYQRLRGECQEVLYNQGRAFHQLGVLHMACHFYKQVLLTEPENRDASCYLSSDLRPEAAFNLALIYASSKNRHLALHILNKFCRI